jgi:hypothetical protein
VRAETDRFDWLADPKHRRSALRSVHTAVRRGWLDGPGPELAARRQALYDALAALVDDDATPIIEICRIAKILWAMNGTRIRW